MKKWLIALGPMLALWAAPAHGGTVFFDDFEGDALLPHWFQPSPSSWEHNVSNGMLNVTGLFSPSHPKSPSNFAWMLALFAPQTDFQMDVLMGWEAGQQPHRLAVHVGGPFGGSPIIASMGYRNEAAFGPIPLIYGSTGGGQSLSIPAPAPGIHHFTITRTAGEFNFFFNGSRLASFQDNFGTPAAAVWLEFLGPYPGTLGAFHVDRIQVIPAPGAFALILALPLCCKSRRTRRFLCW